MGSLLKPIIANVVAMEMDHVLVIISTRDACETVTTIALAHLSLHFLVVLVILVNRAEPMSGYYILKYLEVPGKIDHAGICEPPGSLRQCMKGFQDQWGL
jgi:hypothetical protein